MTRGPRCQLCGDASGGPWGIHDKNGEEWCEQCLKLEQVISDTLRSSYDGAPQYSPLYVMGRALQAAQARTGWPDHPNVCSTCLRPFSKDVDVCPHCTYLANICRGCKRTAEQCRLLLREKPPRLCCKLCPHEHSECSGCGYTEKRCNGTIKVGFVKCCPDCNHVHPPKLAPLPNQRGARSQSGQKRKGSN